MAFDRSIVEPFGKLALPRQRAMPLALVIGKPAQLPLRQLEFEQRQHRIGPGAGFDQALDPYRKAARGFADDFRYETGGHGRRVVKAIDQSILKFGEKQHGVISLKARPLCATAPAT